MITRRALFGLSAALLLGSGCAVLDSLPGATPSLPPPEPFGDFAVGEFGGVDGRQNILRVGADGDALLISGAPAAGRLADADLARLRELLTSEEFRVEVARGKQRRSDPQLCSDQIITEVSMGSLSLSRSDPCGSDDLPAAPAFAEILSLLAPARQGDFAGPVANPAPRSVPVRLERLTEPGYVIAVERSGRGTITESGRTRAARLSAEQRDTLRLLAPLLAGGTATCTTKPYYRIQVAGVEVRPDCNRRYPEIRALAALLDDAFGR